MGNAQNVLIGADGAAAFASAETTLPTAWDDVLDSGFDDLGFISDDGATEAIGSTIQNIKNWRGDTVRAVQTEHTLTYSFTLIETNQNTENVFYGGDPAQGIQGIQGKRGAWVLDVFDGDPDDGGAQIRVVIPDGQVTERGNIVYKNDSAIAYQLTITAYPDETGAKAYKYRSNAETVS